MFQCSTHQPLPLPPGRSQVRPAGGQWSSRPLQLKHAYPPSQQRAISHGRPARAAAWSLAHCTGVAPKEIRSAGFRGCRAGTVGTPLRGCGAAVLWALCLWRVWGPGPGPSAGFDLTRHLRVAARRGRRPPARHRLCNTPVAALSAGSGRRTQTALALLLSSRPPRTTAPRRRARAGVGCWPIGVVDSVSAQLASGTPWQRGVLRISKARYVPEQLRALRSGFAAKARSDCANVDCKGTRCLYNDRVGLRTWMGGQTQHCKEDQSAPIPYSPVKFAHARVDELQRLCSRMATGGANTPPGPRRPVPMTHMLMGLPRLRPRQ